MTPLRILFGLSWPIALRRLLGLFAFAYAWLHFSIWLVVDHFFDWREMGADIVKRPYVTVGMTALTLMLPLAATSTAAAIRKLGGKNWQRLHRLAYAIGVCGVLHYLWLAKKANPAPYYYAAVLGLAPGDPWMGLGPSSSRAAQGGHPSSCGPDGLGNPFASGREVKAKGARRQRPERSPAPLLAGGVVRVLAGGVIRRVEHFLDLGQSLP